MADSPTSYKEWQVPPAAASEDRKLSWLNEANEEGAAWLKSQRGTADWKKALETIAGKFDMTDIPLYRSQMNTNHLKRNVREITGTLARLRPLWGYNSDNGAYKENASMMNSVTKAWYLESFADLSIKEALQYAAGTCTGWIRPVQSLDIATWKSETKLLSYGAPCVLPVQLPANGDYQQAYAVTLLDELPIYKAHAMFPLYQEKLVPTSSMYWYASEIRTAAKGNLFKRMFSGGQRRESANGCSDLLIPVRYTYVIDNTINRTDQMIPMGEPGSSWYYEVPYMGMRLPDGSIANERQARLYPRRRLLISSETCCMYDGPPFDIHGMLPLVPFTTDRWPWEPNGFSMVRDGYEIQLTISELERGMADKCRAQNDMALAYDINSVSSSEAKKFDPMQPRGRIGFDGTQVDEPFKPVTPPEVLKVTQEMFLFLDHLKTAMDEQHAIKDVMALAKARLAGDDIEKMMEANGPIIEDMSRSMEPPMRMIGEQLKYLIIQHWTTARVMQYVGADKISPAVFDYDPQKLIPSHAPGESPGTKLKPIPSKLSQADRGRIFADNLRFFITPNSLHEMTQMVMKLGLIQLKKAGVQIDSETIADAWGIGNYGHIEGVTVREKWKNEQEEIIEMSVRAEALKGTMEAAGGAGILAMPMPQLPALGVPTAEGRPPSGHAAPKLVSKDGGLRSTITES